MANNKPYKFCRQCGNRFSNDKLSDHERQCKKNDAQKPDSFDSKSKKCDSKNEIVEDKDSAEEMQESTETLEEELAKEEKDKAKPSSDRLNSKTDSQSTYTFFAKTRQGGGASQSKLEKSEEKSIMSPSNDSEEGEKLSSSDSIKDSQKYSSESKKRFKKQTSSRHETTTKSGGTSQTEKQAKDPKTSNTRNGKNSKNQISSRHETNAKSGGTSQTDKSVKDPNSSNTRNRKNSNSRPKKIDPITGRKKLHEAKDENNQDNKSFPNPHKGGEAAQSQTSKRKSSRSCDCVRKPSTPIRNISEKKNEERSSSSPKKTEPITEQKKSSQAKDQDKLFAKTRQSGEDSQLKPYKRYSSRSCNCVKKSSSTLSKNPDPIGKNNKLELKENQVKPSPRRKSFSKEKRSKTSDIKHDSKIIYSSKDDKKKDNTALEENSPTKIDKQFPCKFCGETLPTEEVPTHERLCGKRPYKDHELKIE